jgi:hypothetical protein
VARLGRLDDLRRLAVVHALSAAADAFFTVSLAGSLFFNVSVEAARPRLLFYLLITMAPFVVLAPLIGPFVDRVRGGQRTVLVAACIGRAALTLALVEDLRTLLMFPEAFGVLVLGKSYSIGRSATVPRLVDDQTELVAANAFLARIGLVASAIGGGAAVLVLKNGDAALVLAAATVLFLAAGAMAMTIGRPADSLGSRQTRMEYHELHAVRLTRAVQAMGLLRAAVGTLTFMLAFALKRSGAPVWNFGAVIVAGGVGAMAATVISARLRAHFTEEKILVFALAMPAAIAMVGVLHFSIVTAVLVSASVGAAAAGGKHVFDSFAQRTAPDANMARAFAGFETRFQLFWITGAALAVLAQADPRLGLLVIAFVLAGGAVATNVSLSESDRLEASPTVVAAISQLVLEDAPVHDAPHAMLDAAQVLLKGGSPRAAILVATAALDAHHDLAARPDGEAAAALPDDASARLAAMRDSVVSGRPITTDDADRAIATVQAALG